MEGLLKLISSQNVLSFALGLPAPELFPAEVIANSCRRVVAQPEGLQYRAPHSRLKEHVAGIMASRGYPCSEDRILITTGAQQALALIVRLLLDKGGTVLTEELAYPTFMRVLEPYSPVIFPMPTDARTGIDVDALERYLADGQRPALLYTMSDGHNPLGLSMPAANRRRLAQIAREYALPVIEDDAYGLLSYLQCQAPISSYEPEGTFYVGSFSKVLAPSLRAGWIVAPRHLIPILSTLKEAADINTASLSQSIVTECLDHFDLNDHVGMLVKEYRRRRDTMIQALERYFPDTATYVTPPCGFFIWVSLNMDIDTVAVCKRAIEEEKVAFIPGSNFAVGGHDRAKSCLRLNFSNCRPDVIDDGIKRLAGVIGRLRA